MKYPVVLLRQVRQDVNEIAEYLNDQAERLPPLFQEELHTTIESIRQFPHSYRLKRKGFREVQIGRFKILLIYKVHSNKVWIHRLVHAARKPGLRYKK